MKKFLTIFLILFSFTSIFTLVSCGDKTIPIETLSFEESEIELFKGQGKYLHLVVTPKNAKNFKLEWSTSNKEIATISSNGKVQSVNYGQAIITCAVKDTDVKATCIVNVTDGQVFDMYVDEYSVIKDYYEGQTFNETGMTVWVRYQSGINKQLSREEYEIIVPETLSIGDKLEIKYKNYIYEIELNVKEDYITSIEVSSPPIKTDYYVGESFDSTGMIVSLVYASGKKIETTDYTLSSSHLSYNDNSIKIIYNESISCIQPLNVKPNHIVSIYSNLQSIIDSASYGDSIMITGNHYNVDSVVIPKSKNLTIYGALQDNLTTISTLNSPTFILLNDTDDENNQTTIANLILNSNDTNVSPIITIDETESINSLNNLTLLLDNLTINYNSTAINISATSNPLYQNQTIENLKIEIKNCNFINNITENTSNAVVLNNVNNSSISINDSNIENNNNCLQIINCNNIKINVSNSIIEGKNNALYIENVNNSEIKIEDNSYLNGLNCIFINNSNDNIFDINSSYLISKTSEIENNSSENGILYLLSSKNNVLTVKESNLSNINKNTENNVIIYIVLIEDGENQSSNNEITFNLCEIEYDENYNMFNNLEETQTSKIVII